MVSSSNRPAFRAGLLLIDSFFSESLHTKELVSVFILVDASDSRRIEL